MNIGIFLGHPAHFHMLKNSAEALKMLGHTIYFVAKRKDILEQLLNGAGYSYTLIREGRSTGFVGLVRSVLVMERNMCKFLHQNQIDLLIGTTLSFASRVIMRIPTIVMAEDDAAIVPRYSKMVYPWANEILTPIVCDNGKWDNKSLKYPSYHELAYLHPNHFIPQKGVVKDAGINPDEPYFILRFALLNAHHDSGIKGFSTELMQRLIDTLTPYGKVYITSERALEPQFEPYRMQINPLDMHHVMAYASLYIGDSQTMAMESGVLGVPFIRFSDFVGKISVFKELEDHYELGYGILPSDSERLFTVLGSLLADNNKQQTFAQRRAAMLSDKVDYAKFLTWFVEHYPASATEARAGGKEFWSRFK